MTSLLIKRLHTVVTCDQEDRVLHDVDLYCQDGVITALGGAPAPPADEVIDGTHLICYPGLVNTHHHLYQLLSRNLPEVQGLELFDWLTALYEIWQRLDEEAAYLAALAGLGELMKNGCTTCFDHHYVFPRRGGDLLGAQFAAAGELGIRLHASRGSMDLSRRDGGLPPESVVQSIDEILADSRRLIERYHDSSLGARQAIALAPCSPFSVSADLLRESAALARHYGVRLHTHLCETRDEERFTEEKYGLRPLAYLRSLGWVGPDVWYAHGIYFTDAELRELAQAGAGVALCPASNMKLSSGVAPVPRMLELGVPLGLAVDGSASNDGNNLLAELRLCYLLHRLHWGKAAPGGYEILKIATSGGASLLGRADLGSLDVGKCADLFLIDTRRLELAGALLDPRALLCTVGLGGPVDYTVVHGMVTVREGRLTGVDEERLAERVKRKVRTYLAR